MTTAGKRAPGQFWSREAACDPAVQEIEDLPGSDIRQYPSRRRWRIVDQDVEGGATQSPRLLGDYSFIRCPRCWLIFVVMV